MDKQPIEIVAHHGGFGRHRAHLLELFKLGNRLVFGLLRQLGVLDLLLELRDVVAFVVVAQLLLNGLHLLVQIIFALGLLHLTLDAASDFALDLEHGNLALHQGEHASSRSETESCSSISCLSPILMARCEAIVSASFE